MTQETIKKPDFKPNAMQQKCIDNVDGIYMVLAGPGTGKTFTLTRRIRSMVQDKGISPDKILCLTYSDAAATEMKTRLIDLLGEKAVNMQISTFHGLCNSIIQENPDRFDFDDDVTLIDAVAQKTLAKKCLDDANSNGVDLTLLKDRWGNYFNAENTIIRAVSDIKSNRITKEILDRNIETNQDWKPALEELIAKFEEAKSKNRGTKTVEGNIEKMKNKIAKAELVWNLANDYMKLMAKHNYIEFADMVVSVVDVLEDDYEFAKNTLGKYKYVLIDEYQDTNTLQNLLIDNIVAISDEPNLFVVGDDDQIIYGFQGASLENCENFLRKYPQAQVICLTENNRSAQTILDFGYDVISQDDKRLEKNKDFSKYEISKKLTAKNQSVIDKDTPIKFLVFEDEITQYNQIVQKIKEIIENNPKQKLSEIAVLSRKHSFLEELSRLLYAEKIPYQKKTNKTIFDVQSSLLIYSYLKILNNRMASRDSQFPLLLTEPFKIDEEDYNFILSKNCPVCRDFITIIDENIDHEWKNPEKIHNFIDTYKLLSDLKFRKSLGNLLIQVANQTGILAYYANSKIDTEDNILAIKRIIAEANAYKKIYLKNQLDEEINHAPYLSDFLEYLDKAYKSGAAPELEKSKDTINAVQLLTYHGSKGREFSHVFMPWLTSKNFESKRDIYDFKLPTEAYLPENKDDVKRSELLKLLFVGVTRAKYDLYLSFAMYDDNQKPQIFSDLLKDVVEKFENKQVSTVKGVSFVDNVVQSLTDNNLENYEEFIKAQIEDFQLSTHSFSEYKKCPRKFYYSNILKLPVCDDEDKGFFNLGNAIHAAFNKLVSSAKKNNFYMSKDEVKEAFVGYLDTYKFIDEDSYNKYKNRGFLAIDNYYHHITDIPIKNIFGYEYKFDNLDFEGMKLKGFIDFIEKKEDGSLAIFDYKTGSKKSKSDVQIGSSYENYFHQLLFYKLAVESIIGKTVSETGFKFVEEENPDLDIQYLAQDVVEFKEELKRVISEIKNCNFEPIDKIDANCKTCQDCQYNLICKILLKSN